jgi:uncharacterized protein YqjF (DUF2071 family)
MHVSKIEALLRESDHRPWPMPAGPWIMFQSWQRQLFMHWPMAPETLRPLVPAPLELDTYDGMAYVSVTPFLLANLRLRMLPPVPTASDFQEINLRTYVRVKGRPGVYFFSLDAASRLAVACARLSFHLPYFFADMTMKREGDWTDYRSRRVASPAELAVRYRPVGNPFRAAPGTLDHFLIERYALYVVHRGRVTRGDIHHSPWRLRAAEVVIERNTITAAHAIELPASTPLAHFSDRQDTVLWGPTRKL